MLQDLDLAGELAQRILDAVDARFDAAAVLRPHGGRRLRRGLRLLAAIIEQVAEQAAGLLRESETARRRQTSGEDRTAKEGAGACHVNEFGGQFGIQRENDL